MEQMKWRKYPDVIPDADGMYLAVVEYGMQEGIKECPILPIQFTHDLAEALPWNSKFEGEHRPGWYNWQPDFKNKKYTFWEQQNVVYWMPFPDLPNELKSM